MRCHRLISIGCMVVLLCLPAFLSSQDQMPKKADEKPDPPRLIRRDLLVTGNKKLDPPKRNIFTAQSSGWQEPVEFEERGQINRVEREEAEALAQEGMAALTLSLRYIGYVKSGQKMTALILFEGEALAVQEGEMLVEGMTVLRITVEEIEVISPDQESRKFPLEGETP